MDNKQQIAQMIAEDRRFGEKKSGTGNKNKGNVGVQQKKVNFKNMRPQDFLDMDDDE